jgi:hypothetical protein
MRSASTQLAAYRSDTPEWPIVYRPSLGRVADSDIDSESFYDEAFKLLARGERVAYVHDLSGGKPMSATRRRRFSRFIEDERERLQRYVACVAVVLDSRVFEGVVTAVTWVVPPFVPLKVFYSDKNAAYEWARSQLEAKLHGSPILAG